MGRELGERKGIKLVVDLASSHRLTFSFGFGYKLKRIHRRSMGWAVDCRSCGSGRKEI